MRYRVVEEPGGGVALARMFGIADADRYIPVGPRRWQFTGAEGQGVTSNIGGTGRPGVDSFRTSIRCSVPAGVPDERAWLLGFSQSELLHVDGEAKTLAVWWEAGTGDLVLTLWGETTSDYRRLTVANHAIDHAGETVTLTIARDAAAGTLTILQDDVALDGVESIGGTAPSWSAEVDARWMHVCGAKDQGALPTGYVGRLLDVDHAVQPRRTAFARTGSTTSAPIVALGAAGNVAGDPFTLAVTFALPPTGGSNTAIPVSLGRSDGFTGTDTVYAAYSASGNLNWTLGGESRNLPFGNVAVYAGRTVSMWIARNGTTVNGYLFVDGVLTVTATNTHASWGKILSSDRLGVNVQSFGLSMTVYDAQLHNYALSQSEIEALIAGGLTDEGLVQGGQQLLTTGPSNSPYGPFRFTSVSGDRESATGVYNGSNATNRLSFSMGSGVGVVDGQLYRLRFNYSFEGAWFRAYSSHNSNLDTFSPSKYLIDQVDGPTGSGSVSTTFFVTGTQVAATFRLGFIVSTPTGDLTLSNVRVSPLGCVLHWRFLDGTGSTIADSSGNDLHGTATGGSWETVGDPFQPEPVPVLHWDLTQPSLTIEDAINGLDGSMSEAAWRALGIRWEPPRARVWDAAWYPPEGGDPVFLLPDRISAPATLGEAGWYPGPPDTRFDLTSEVVPRVFVGGSVEEPAADEYGRLLRITTGATSITDYQLTATFREIEGSSAITWESSDESVATVDAHGYVTALTPNQSVTITATSADGVVRQRTLWISTEGGATVTDHIGWESGSLMEHMDAQIRSRIAGKSASVSKPIFSTINHSTATYARNPNCWAYDLDLTCIAVARKAPGGSWTTSTGATAITDQHILMAGHAMHAVGTTYRFVTAAGEVIERTLVKRRRHPDYSNVYPDLAVGVLDEALPESIAPVAILPADVVEYLPILGVLNLGSGPGGPSEPGRGLPVLATDQQNKALIHAWAFEGLYATSDQLVDLLALGAPNSLHYDAGGFEEFAEAKIGGDSGWPNFVVAEDALGLLGPTTYAGGGSNTACSLFASDLNSLIAAVDADAGISTGRTVSIRNLSTFINYA